MYFLALITMFVLLILSFIEVTLEDNGFVIFFGIISVLLLCVGCVLLHRILYEICMSFLQIPKLINIMSRIEQALDVSNNNNSNINTNNITSGNTSINNKPLTQGGGDTLAQNFQSNGFADE